MATKAIESSLLWRLVSSCTSCTHHVSWMLLRNKKYCYIFTTIHIIYTTITICLAFLFSSWSDNNNDIWMAFGCRIHRNNWYWVFSFCRRRTKSIPSLRCDAGLLPHNHCILMGSPVRGGDRCFSLVHYVWSSRVGIPALQPITPSGFIFISDSVQATTMTIKRRRSDENRFDARKERQIATYFSNIDKW